MTLLLPAALLLGAAAPDGAQIVRHGNRHGVLPCMACHGANLEGNASIGAPRLAGLPQATTLAAFHLIASGKMGKNYVMRNIAHSLTPAERQAVATYLAGIKTAP